MTHSLYKTFSKLRMSCIVTFLCLHNFYFAAKNIEVKYFVISHCSHSYTVQLANWNFIDWKAPPLKLDFLEIELRTGEMSGCHRCSCAVGGGQCRSLCHSPSSLLLCCQSSSQVSYFYLFACCGILDWSELCRRYAAKKLKNVLPSKFVLNQSRSRVSPMAQRNQDEVESQGIEMEERPADPNRHMWSISAVRVAF